jgi:diguanylate cyclase (GGDEF)-like protein
MATLAEVMRAVEVKPKAKNGSISIRLLIWFLLVSMAPLAIFGYIAYQSSISIVRKELNANLVNLAEVKAAGLVTYMDERRVEAVHIARAPHLIKATKRLNALFASGVPSVESLYPFYREFGPNLNLNIEGLGFSDMHILSLGGLVLYDASFHVAHGTYLDDGPYAFTRLRRSFEKSLEGKTFVSDFEFDGQTKAIGAYITTPIMDSGRIIGVVALGLSSAHINKMVADYNDFAVSGETLLGMKVNDEAVFITPVKLDPDAALQRTVPLGQAGRGIPMNAALNGESGSGVGRDYRGAKVLAAWKYIPGLNWGLVVKVDADEAFAPIRRLTAYMAVLAVLAIAVVVFFSLIVSQSIAAPIIDLTAAAERIGSGDMTAGLALSAARNDELGALVKAFKTMAKKRKEAEESLESSNAKIVCVNSALEEKIAEINESRQKLEELARTDSLTGLYNRRYFIENFDREFKRAARTGEPMSVLMMDADDFKSVNDRHGHLTGDRVLAAVAGIIKRKLRETDFACRYGGEEFAMILTNTRRDGAVAMAERLREEIKAYEHTSDIGETFHATCSMGIVEYLPSDAGSTAMNNVTMETLLRDADAALYTAKESGRDRIVYG